MTLNTGMVLNNRYRIVKLLGQGGFGAVYRAWDLSLNKPVALKENLDTSPEAQRQFQLEAHILANLSHPNLPRVTDHFAIPGMGQYLVMDFIEGEDLHVMLDRARGPLPEGYVLEWMNQVCDALLYLHSQNPPIIHRDIKPANIKITPQGRAMLVDFGISKVFNAALRTTVGARAVTPGYSPPEQYGQGHTDPRTDIYALGATLYTLLTGREPPESVQRIVNDTMPKPCQVNVRVTPQVGLAIERAMFLSPTQRYQSAAEFRAALSAPASRSMPGPIPAPPQPTPSHGQRRSSRGLYWTVGAIGAICITVILIVGIWVTRQLSQPQIVVQTVVVGPAPDMTGTAMAAQLAAIRAEQTVTAQANATATAQARTAATDQARANFVSTVEAGQTRVFGPKDSSLVHKVDEYVEVDSTGVDLRDFAVEAVFFNPYSASTGSWDYGFLFRDEGISNKQFRLVIRSISTWELRNNTGEPNGTTVDKGQIPNLDVGEGGSNQVNLICQGNTGLLYINGVFIAELDLLARTNSGDVRIATGMYTGDEINGKTTRYEDFTVWSIR